MWSQSFSFVRSLRRRNSMSFELKSFRCTEIGTPSWNPLFSESIIPPQSTSVIPVRKQHWRTPYAFLTRNLEWKPSVEPIQFQFLNCQTLHVFRVPSESSQQGLEVPDISKNSVSKWREPLRKTRCLRPSNYISSVYIRHLASCGRRIVC